MKRVRESLPITDPNLKQALMEYGHAINGLKSLFKEDADGNEYLDKIRNADGDTYVEVTDDDVIHFYRAGSEIGQFNSNGLNLAVGKGLVDADGDTYVTVEETEDEDIIHFYTAGSERVTIDDEFTKIGTAGNVKITSDGAHLLFSRGSINYIKATSSGGYFRFCVNGNDDSNPSLILDSNGDFTVRNGDITVTNGDITIKDGGRCYVNNPDNTVSAYFRQDNSNAFVESGTGNVILNWQGGGHARTGNGSGDYGIHYASEFKVSSDRKLKTDITDYDKSAIDIVKKFKIKKYKMVNDNYKREHIGLIAQEIQTVLPEIVEEVPDPDKETTILTHSLNDLIFLNIKAIQELEDKLNNLQEQINDIRQSATKESIN